MAYCALKDLGWFVCFFYQNLVIKEHLEDFSFNMNLKKNQVFKKSVSIKTVTYRCLFPFEKALGFLYWGATLTTKISTL